MFQKCPICDGLGTQGEYGAKCETCNGKKIINEINGLPPSNITSNIKPTIECSTYYCPFDRKELIERSWFLFCEECKRWYLLSWINNVDLNLQEIS